MSFEKMDTEDSASSFGKVSSVDNDFDAMYLESDGSNEGCGCDVRKRCAGCCEKIR